MCISLPFSPVTMSIPSFYTSLITRKALTFQSVTTSFTDLRVILELVLRRARLLYKVHVSI